MFLLSLLGFMLTYRPPGPKRRAHVEALLKMMPALGRGLPPHRDARRRAAAMALAALSGDEQLVIFVQLCNVLDPGVAVAFGSASSELWTATQAPRQ